MKFYIWPDLRTLILNLWMRYSKDRVALKRQIFKWKNVANSLGLL
jgi:hypothetical protein